MRWLPSCSLTHVAVLHAGCRDLERWLPAPDSDPGLDGCRPFRVRDRAVTHQSDPFSCPCSTSPNGLAVLAGERERLPRLQGGRRRELLLVLAMPEVLSELFLRQLWIGHQGLHLSRPVVASPIAFGVL